MAEATGAPTAAHQLDAEPLPVKPDRFLADGDTIAVGDLTFDVIHLRGHTPGSVALALAAGRRRPPPSCSPVTACFPAVLGGQTWTQATSNRSSTGLETEVFDVYGDDTVVYPGHGDDTTLGAERPHLAEWRERGW